MARTSGIKVSTGRGRKQFSILTAMVVIGVILFSPKMQVQAAAADDNSRPTAAISGTLLVYEGATVYLNGDFSSDPAGNAINYRWALVSSPKNSTAVMLGSSDAHASFTANVTGVYQVQLIVNNGFVDSKPAHATITVIRHPYMW
jgi:K319-like protein